MKTRGGRRPANVRRRRCPAVGDALPLVVTALAAAWACGGDASGPVAGEPAAIAAVAGDGQTGIVGLVLPESAAVRVTDEAGRPVPEVSVAWTVAAGGGSVSSGTATTDDDGVAMTAWTLGPDPGANTLRAEAGGPTAELTATAEHARPGERYEGRRGYIDYIAGELPIVISAPHGGTLEPAEIPDRTYGTMVRDLNTTELAHAIADELEARTGARPHLVTCLLRRTKLDANRDLEEAAQGDPAAERAWHDFHAFIGYAQERLADAYGAGFYIDVHGHGHEIQRLELGYLLSADDLSRSDEQLLRSDYAERSSIRTLAETADADFVELLRGATSLGTLYEDAGFPAVPSTQQPDPGGAPYFSGGYNTRRWGSRDGGPVSGVQIEANRRGVRDNATQRQAFAEATADVLIAYFREHYGIELAEAASVPARSTPAAATVSFGMP